MGLVYVDSCVLIYAMEQDPLFGEAARNCLSWQLAQNLQLAISPLVQLKCLVHPLARQQGELIIRYQAWLQTFQWLSINDKDSNRSVPIGNASPSARPNESTTLNQPRPINNSAPWRAFLALHEPLDLANPLQRGSPHLLLEPRRTGVHKRFQIFLALEGIPQLALQPGPLDEIPALEKSVQGPKARQPTEPTE